MRSFKRSDMPFMTKDWWRNSHRKTMATLSKLSKAFLLPIALLPIAGVFLGIGATIAEKADNLSALWYFGSFLKTMGDVAFGNLPVLFAVSVAIAYTEDAGVAAITAVIGFLVFNGIQSAFLTPDVKHWQYTVDIFSDGKLKYENFKVDTDVKDFFESSELLKWMKNSDIYNELVKGDNVSLSIKGASEVVDKYSMLFYHGEKWGVLEKLTIQNLGILSLNTGVFAGIFVGAIAAWSFNKFHKTQLPSAISFFSGSKLVPIVMFVAVIPLSFIFIFTWPLIGTGLAWFGNNSGKLPGGLDSFIFEIFERSLVPFGLHHVFYSPLWWTQAGGSMADLITSALKDPLKYPQFLEDIQKLLGTTYDLSDKSQAATLVATWVGKLLPDTISSVGDQTMMYKVINDPYISFTIVQDLGLNLGRFQTGKFPFMMFGLPAAATAMWFAVPKENRKKVMGIYFSAAFTCFLTGITEPIEFTFLFVAPWMFYGIHMPLCAISFLLMGVLHVHVAMTVSGGFIDFIVFGIIPYAKGTNFYHILWVGAIYVPVYFIAFSLAIRWGKVQIPGLDGKTDKLYSKADVKAKSGGGVESAVKAAAGFDPKREKAAKIIEFLGGPNNITGVDSCASRLRVTVIDNKLVDADGIKSLGGCNGVLIRGESVHCIYGGEQEVIKPYMHEILNDIKNNKVKPKTQ